MHWQCAEIDQMVTLLLLSKATRVEGEGVRVLEYKTAYVWIEFVRCDKAES